MAVATDAFVALGYATSRSLGTRCAFIPPHIA